MLKKRPVLAGAVALAMGLTFLSGCGGDTVPTGDNGDTSGSTGSTTTMANAVSEIPGVAKTYQLAAKVNGTAVKTMVLQEPSFDEQSGGSLGLSGPFFLTGSGTIPEGLSSTICQAFQGGNEKEILSSMMDDTEITREEFFRRVGDTWLEEAGWSAQDSVPSCWLFVWMVTTTVSRILRARYSPRVRQDFPLSIFLRGWGREHIPTLTFSIPFWRNLAF